MKLVRLFTWQLSRPNCLTSFRKVCKELEVKKLKFIFSANIGERVWDSFKETPPMYTYIVAFVVSDLKSVFIQDGKNTVWLREDVRLQGKICLIHCSGHKHVTGELHRNNV